MSFFLSLHRRLAKFYADDWPSFMPTIGQVLCRRLAKMKPIIHLAYQFLFYTVVSQSVTKKMQFFFFQSVVFTPFLRYINGRV